jgi:zinc transporter 1/2/3
MAYAASFDPTHVDLTTANQADIICFFALGENEYNGLIGARISSIFVIGFISTLATYFPVFARQNPRCKIPFSIYTFARFFGSGVIVATAFIHLLDPAYEAIGPGSCIAASGIWAQYPWCAAIVLASIMLVFCVDLGADVYVERRFGVAHHVLNEDAVANAFVRSIEPGCMSVAQDIEVPQQQQQQEDEDEATPRKDTASCSSRTTSPQARVSFAQQISAFIVLEFGIIFHSVIIGLNLGVVASSTFTTLYPVLVFHQSFEGLGIGARLSNIAFPCSKAWMPGALCALYGLTTPVAIAIGLAVRTTYVPESRVSIMVQGVLNAVSAGFLIYSGLVELLAKDFLFDKDRTKDLGRLGLAITCVFVGAAAMALIGYWA